MDAARGAGESRKALEGGLLLLLALQRSWAERVGGFVNVVAVLRGRARQNRRERTGGDVGVQRSGCRSRGLSQSSVRSQAQAQRSSTVCCSTAMLFRR